MLPWPNLHLFIPAFYIDIVGIAFIHVSLPEGQHLPLFYGASLSTCREQAANIKSRADVSRVITPWTAVWKFLLNCSGQLLCSPNEQRENRDMFCYVQLFLISAYFGHVLPLCGCVSGPESLCVCEADSMSMNCVSYLGICICGH